jgi:hypothetical protein
MTSAEFEAAGLSFNKEGEFAKMDASGRLRRVDEYGVIVSGRRDPDRPDDISPKIWHSMRAEAKRKAKAAKRGASSSSDAPVACAPLGIAGLLTGGPARPEVRELSRALPAPIQADYVRDCGQGYAEAPVPAWDQFDMDIEHERFHVALGGYTGEVRDADDEYLHVPAMPCAAAAPSELGHLQRCIMEVALPDEVHRDRLSDKIFPFNACVAQPIFRKEVARIPAAKAAMQVEWDRLFQKQVGYCVGG